MATNSITATGETAADRAVRSRRERAARLRAEVVRLRVLARSCDATIAQQFIQLANEMQVVVNQLQEADPDADPERSKPSADHHL
ncbi:MAG: hypothetical protein ACYCZX_01790 [Rhodospirillaceae bacterium]